MESLKVEYLIVIKKKGSFCDQVETFLNFLKADSKISVQRNHKTFSYNGEDKASIKVGYEIQTGEVEEQRFFHIKLLYGLKDGDLNRQIELYGQFLKTLKSNIHRLDIEFHVIWNDISLFYAQRAYPLIYEIENLMRKLIMKFMVTTLGIGWVDETLPEEVKRIVDKKQDRRKDQSNFLYKIDFTDLASFLIKPYQTGDTTKLYKDFSKANDISELDLDYLKSFVPRSNWQRYFSKIIDYEGERFNRRWEELYQLRCQVAHNNQCTLSDYSKIIEIIEEIKEKLEEAIAKLDKIEISEEEREEAAESISISINSLNGKFLERWKYLEKEIDRIFPSDKTRDARKIPVRWKLQKLHKEGVIRQNLFAKILVLNHLRNNIVHHFDFAIGAEELTDQIKKLERICAELSNIPPCKDDEASEHNKQAENFYEP
jgi:hypothetical protein